MAWSMPNTGQWSQGMAVVPDIMNNMGSYTPDQWAAMQQQNWQQWHSWQQQYAQWQNQYGDKYNEQVHAIQAMGGMPPLPPASSAPPPAPPPPDKPPPPPHENNQPLYGQARQPAPVPPPPQKQLNTQAIYNYPNNASGNTQSQNWSYSAPQPQVEIPPPSVNAEALKKLAEEERLFDIQFKKWEEEIEKWRSENVNHPDKQAYKEYEQKFEACRAQLLERRIQMKQKRANLLGTASQSSIPPPSHQLTSVPPPPPPQNTQNNQNYNININKQPIQQQQTQSNAPSYNDYNDQGNTQYQQYNQGPTNNKPYNRNNIKDVNPQDRYDSYGDMEEVYHPDDYSSNHANSNFLPASGSTKGIPGLDLVPDTDKAAKKSEVIEIIDDQMPSNKALAPDYTTISKGINNILGDEKIMNILSMVRSSQFPNEVAHNPGNSYPGSNSVPHSNQGDMNSNNYNNMQHDHRQNIPYNNRQSSNGNYHGQQNQNVDQNYPPHRRGYGEGNDYPQEEYYDDETAYNDMGSYENERQMSGPPPMRPNIPPNRPQAPLNDISGQQNINEPPRGMMDRRPLPRNPVPKWVDEPLFTPSIIVEYEHKPLRLKARDFIEPVHMFDYNHKSKDGDVKIDFEREVDEVFSRKPRRFERSDESTIMDKYSRDPYSRDYERRARREEYSAPREDFRVRDELREDYRARPPHRVEAEERRRPPERYDERRRDDRDRSRRDDYRERDRERARDHRRDDVITRSRSRDKDSRKRGHSRDSEISTGSKKSKEQDMKSSEQPKHIVMIDDILELPGRQMRPEKIVIILRGPPGSGKSYLAKLIRDREAECGGTVRIMSIDDYYMQEGEIEEKDPITGKITRKPSLKYEFDQKCEESYMNSLKRAFKRSITDGYFSFMIYDAVNDQLKSYADIWNFARLNGFQVYICTMELDPQTCFKRNIHNRTLEDIEVICARFFPTPAHHIQLDATTLLQSAAITDVHMEDIDDEVIMEDAEPEVESALVSRWEKMDDAAQLARLDGISKPLRPSQLSMEDYLQLDDWKPNAAKPGKKSVRWADIEERRQQQKMRAIGFVVGQTDWNRMTDPTMGSSALTQTKYIERVRRN